METHFENFEKAQGAQARQRVYADLRNLARDAEDLLKVTASDVSEKAKEARVKLAAALERAKSNCADLEERTLAGAQEAAKKADATIRAHPYESMGVAFGIGLLIGVLVTRK